MENAPARLLAEFVGTFALIFIGAGSIMTAAELAGGGYSLIGIAAAHGFVLAVMISALGHVSGGHFNPAVSLGVLIAKGIKPVEFVAYVVTQLVAATIAALALSVIYATAVKDATGLPVIAVGLITDYDQAEAIVASGEADLVGLARGILYDPRWPWHAAAHLGASVAAPNQYLRSQPHEYRDLFDNEELAR